jgi:hypothetical protein
VAVVETSGLAKLLHQLEEDGVVIPEDLDQQTDQKTAERAHKEREQAGIQPDGQLGLLPDQAGSLIYEDHEDKRDHRAGDAQKGN